MYVWIFLASNGKFQDQVIQTVVLLRVFVMMPVQFGTPVNEIKELVINRWVFSMKNCLVMLEIISILQSVNSQDEIFFGIKHIPDDLVVLFCSNCFGMVLLQYTLMLCLLTPSCKFIMVHSYVFPCYIWLSLCK